MEPTTGWGFNREEHRKRVGILVNSRLLGGLINPVIIGRQCAALDIHWKDRQVRVIAAHFEVSRCKKQFANELESFEDLFLHSLPPSSRVVVGADCEDALGVGDDEPVARGDPERHGAVV